MKKTVLVAGALVLASVTSAVPSHTEDPDCFANAGEFTRYFGDKYHEVPTHAATMLDTKRVFLVVTSKDGSTWSAAMSNERGEVCPVAAGYNWVTVGDPS